MWYIGMKGREICDDISCKIELRYKFRVSMIFRKFSWMLLTRKMMNWATTRAAKAPRGDFIIVDVIYAKRVPANPYRQITNH